MNLLYTTKTSDFNQLSKTSRKQRDALQTGLIVGSFVAVFSALKPFGFVIEVYPWFCSSAAGEGWRLRFCGTLCWYWRTCILGGWLYRGHTGTGKGRGEPGDSSTGRAGRERARPWRQNVNRCAATSKSTGDRRSCPRHPQLSSGRTVPSHNTNRSRSPPDSLGSRDNAGHTPSKREGAEVNSTPGTYSDRTARK